MNLFDINIYPKKSIRGVCYSCDGKKKLSPEAHYETSLTFTKMIGINWGDSRVMFVNIKRDFKTLGLKAKMPDIVFLCLPCIVEYMETYNKLLQEHKAKVKQ